MRCICLWRHSGKVKVDDRDRLIKLLQESFEQVKLELDPKNWKIIEGWKQKRKLYKDEVYIV